MALKSHYQETSTLVKSSFSDNGDYIGTESSFEVLSGKTDVDVGFPCENKLKEKTVARDVTPAPPMMLSSHVPWVLKREYTSDGRLLLRQEKASRHEYLQAHRSNGRLTLHLVSLNHDDDDDHHHHDPVENGGNSCFLEGKSR